MKILILSALSDTLIPDLETYLEAQGVKGVTLDTLSDLSLEKADFIFADYSLIEDQELFDAILEQKHKLAILITLNDYSVINRIFYETGVNHLFGLNEAATFSDIKNFIQLKQAKNKWALESLVGKPSRISSAEITTSENLQGQIQTLLKEHDFSQCFDGLENYITNILVEALYNALLNAPIDSKGNYLYRTRNRADSVQMIPGKEVLLKISSDQEKFVISVKDFYGTLTENNLFDYLPQSEMHVKDGMGLGMYLIFRYAHQFIIQVKRHQETENLIVVAKDKRFKHYDLKQKSFHFFHEREG